LRDTEAYAAYLSQDDRSIGAEKEIVKYVFKKIILTAPAIEQVFEEKFINWQVDKEVLQAMVAKTFKNFASEDPSQNQLAELTPNWQEDRQFIMDLLTHSIRYAAEYQQLVAAKT